MEPWKNSDDAPQDIELIVCDYGEKYSSVAVKVYSKYSQYKELNKGDTLWRNELGEIPPP